MSFGYFEAQEYVDAGCPVEPGIIQVHVVNADDLDTVPAVDAGTNTISTAITLGVGKTAKRWDFHEENSNYVETPGDNRLFEKVLSLAIPHEDADLRYDFAQMYKKGGRYAVWVKFPSGQVIFNERMIFRPTFNSGNEGGTDNQGYTCEFRYVGNEAKVYTATIPTT